MKYIKSFESYLSVNPDLTKPNIMFDDMYETIQDDKAIEWAKKHFAHLKFEKIKDRNITDGVTYLTLIFSEPTSNKQYTALVKCKDDKFSFSV